MMISSAANISSATALEVINSFAPQDAVQAAGEPITCAILGIVAAIIALMGAGMGVVSAVVGAVSHPRKPPDAQGDPWTLWVSAGIDGSQAPDDNPLHGAGGPFPEATLYSPTGKVIGRNWDESLYVQEGKWNGLPIWPVDGKWATGQQAHYVTLSVRRPNDPVCLLELGVSRDADANPNSHVAFSAYNAKECGVAPWYHSGDTRDGLDGSATHVPCFWLGTPETMSVQFHLKSHSLSRSPEAVQAINKTVESRHAHACNTPGKMQFYMDSPNRPDMEARLIKDYRKLGDVTLNETLEKVKDPAHKIPGTPIRGYLDSPRHENTLSIARKNHRGLLAEELCTHGTSRGPDWVNVAEGKFCRMSDKSLWPVCSLTKGVLDNCFNMDVRQLVVGGKVTRSMPYRREVLYGEKK